MKYILERISLIIKLTYQGLVGDEKEFTTGSINRSIYLLAVPMVMEMGMEATFALVDMLYISRVSTTSTAAVGITESVVSIIYSLAWGYSMAITAIVSRRAGEKNFDKAADAAFQGMVLSLMLGLVIGVFGYTNAEELLRLMGGSEDLIAEGSGYTKILFATNMVIIFLFVNNSVFRGVGSAATAMVTLGLANGLNIILDPIFIFGLGPIPAMGVEGAAVATTIGRATGVAFQFYMLFNGIELLRITRKNMVVRYKTILEMVKVGSAGAGQFVIESFSWVLLMKIVAEFGEVTVAAYTIAFRVVVFSILPSVGIANAAATLVGQNLGAKDPDRAETIVWRTSKYNAYFMVFIGVIFFSFAGPILDLFGSEPAVKEEAMLLLKIICLGYLFFAYGLVLGQAFNGAGDTKTPMYISIFSFWGVQLPMAYYLSGYTSLGATGVYISIAVSHAVYAVVAIVLFRRGKWKQVEV